MRNFSNCCQKVDSGEWIMWTVNVVRQQRGQIRRRVPLLINSHFVNLERARTHRVYDVEQGWISMKSKT